MSEIVSAEQLKILSITLDAERFNRSLFLAVGKGDGIVVEVNIYEDLSKGYLTGNMIIQDDQDIYRQADLVGTERVTIDFQTPDQSSDIITKTFVVEEIDSSIKTTDYSSMLVLNLIEDIKFYNDLVKYSKAYTGTGEQIISLIVQDKFNREVVNESEKQSVQNVFRYIVPYISPLDAIVKVRDKMTTASGLPFFFYSTIVDNKFHLIDLETIINSTPFNVKKPFVFDQENTQKTDLESQATNITALETDLQESTIQLAIAGGMGFGYESINATSGKFFKTHNDVSEHFEDLKNAGMFPQDQNFIAFDKEFIADPSSVNTNPITQYDARIMRRIVTSPYTDVNGYNQEAFPAQEMLYMIKNSVISHMFKNFYTINVPGILFSTSSIKATVGHLISMNIYRNDTDYNANRKIDEKRSGNFIIVSKRHIFDVSSERHTVSLGLCKLASRRIEE